MTPTLYINRSNAIKISLLQNGNPIVGNTATRVSLLIPDALTNGEDLLLDTDGQNMELIENSTKVLVNLKSVSNVEEGFYSGYLTVFDITNVDGIAWDTIEVYIRHWPIAA